MIPSYHDSTPHPPPPSVSEKSGAGSNFTHLQHLELLHAHDPAETAVQNNLFWHFSRETALHFPSRDRTTGTRTALILWLKSQSEGLAHTGEMGK